MTRVPYVREPVYGVRGMIANGTRLYRTPGYRISNPKEVTEGRGGEGLAVR